MPRAALPYDTVSAWPGRNKQHMPSHGAQPTSRCFIHSPNVRSEKKTNRGLPGLASGKLYKTKYKAVQKLYKSLADKIYLILGKLYKILASAKYPTPRRASDGRVRIPMLCAMVRKSKD